MKIKSIINEEIKLFEYNFNLGNCDIYAVALHRLYNYPLYVVRGYFLEPEWGGKREWDYEDSHIVVKLPNGKYMDSSGEQTKNELLSNVGFSNKIDKIKLMLIDEKIALTTFSCENQESDINNVINIIKSKE
jgi:hypothetical protein